MLLILSGDKELMSNRLDRKYLYVCTGYFFLSRKVSEVCANMYWHNDPQCTHTDCTCTLFVCSMFGEKCGLYWWQKPKYVSETLQIQLCLSDHYRQSHTPTLGIEPWTEWWKARALPAELQWFKNIPVS